VLTFLDTFERQLEGYDLLTARYTRLCRMLEAQKEVMTDFDRKLKNMIEAVPS
jgi:hypothetical protein